MHGQQDSVISWTSNHQPLYLAGNAPLGKMSDPIMPVKSTRNMPELGVSVNSEDAFHHALSILDRKKPSETSRAVWRITVLNSSFVSIIHEFRLVRRCNSGGKWEWRGRCFGVENRRYEWQERLNWTRQGKRQLAKSREPVSIFRVVADFPSLHT